MININRIYLLIVFSFLILFNLSAQPAPKYEVRAAWITAVYGLDWPRTKATTPASIQKQKEELVEILDKLKEANFNTVLFQARTRGDVLYKSDIEPYNSILTGKSGKDPGYDPLAFAVEECHKRGMECHAWMVTIPLGGRKHVASLGKQSVTRRQPKICVPYKREYFLNPGNPKTKEYLMSLVKEVVERYDVDGVHFDYLRYPERAFRFPDSYDYRKYGNGRSLDQWRRDNITEILRYIYKGVKQLKPWVKVSTCPVGKYRDTSRYSSKGWNAFHVVYQDVQGWLGEGIQDQIYPMMYLPHDVLPRQRFLSVRPRLAGAKQWPPRSARPWRLLPPPQRRRLEPGRNTTANQLHTQPSPGRRSTLSGEIRDRQHPKLV